MRNFPLFNIIILLAALSFVLISCKKSGKEEQAASSAQLSGMTVTGVVIQPQQLENIVRSSGTALASESVDLTAEADGRVESILFSEGSHVSKNDLLVKINDDDLQAQLKKVDIQIKLAEEQENRQKQLYEKKLSSDEQWESAKAQSHTLKADRENLLASIRKREIRAPFDGVIGLRYISEGSYVTQTTRIASIQKVNPLKVDFSIPEKYANSISAGDPVQFNSEELRIQFTGRLYAIEPKIDPATRTLQLRALCDNRTEKILPGTYVQIELRLKKNQHALMVPTQAIIPVLKGQTILLQRNCIVESVPVRIGIRTPTLVQIIDGLKAGDTVITSGLMQLRPGMPVKVVVQ
jgi:membrane fusion protein (multidrug efflux system)